MEGDDGWIGVAGAASGTVSIIKSGHAPKAARAAVKSVVFGAEVTCGS